MQRRSGNIRSSRIWLGSDVGKDIGVILDEAREQKATDVHIMAGSVVLFRVDGELRPFSDDVLSASTARHLSCALLSEQQIKRGVHRSTAELEAAINTYIKIRNADPKPFRWIKSADDILASIERFCRRTISDHEAAA